MLDPATIPWRGKAAHRVVVRVLPRDLGTRQSRDESPASVRLDFAALFSFERSPDLSTLQVVRIDPKTGRPIRYGRFTDGLSPYDLPFRYDADDLDPRQFSFMYNVTGHSPSGNLVFTHVQEGDEPSYYVIYVDPASESTGPARRPQLGDVDALCSSREAPIVGILQTAPSIVDWCGDGRIELLVGTYAGYLFTYRLQGDRAHPRFGAPQMLMADGKPIFEVFGAGPKPNAVDWDGDGKLDLLVGLDGELGVILYENVSDDGSPVFTKRGALTDVDGKRILTPPEPCPELPIYKVDYCPYPEAVDWNGDGKLDLLLGGYVTGMIFYYENVSAADSGRPILDYRGPLEADGKVIDVGWTAAPTTADWRSAGVRDLICGSMPVRPNAGYDATAHALFYFENVGTKESPTLRQVPFPLENDDWTGLTGFALPRASDWDGDGKIDLVVGSSTVRLLRNVGTPGKPLFRNEGLLTTAWQHYPVGGCLSAVARDGLVDLISSGESTVAMVPNTSVANPRPYGPPIALTGHDGTPIVHHSETGDDFCFGLLYDFRGTGARDLLIGDAAGEVWFYPAGSGDTPNSFGEGRRLPIQGGGYVRVGADEQKSGWDVHVGARAAVAAGDFNGDGITDLMVGDAFGKITYFENAGSRSEPLFRPGNVVLEGSGRAFVAAADWNGDGLLDLVIGWSGEGILICINEGPATAPKFGARTRIPISQALPYPCPFVCDWDGDGGLDIVTTCSYGFLYALDRGFIEHGYAAGEVIASQMKPQARERRR